jgi:hypothetical protein
MQVNCDLTTGPYRYWHLVVSLFIWSWCVEPASFNCVSIWDPRGGTEVWESTGDPWILNGLSSFTVERPQSDYGSKLSDFRPFELGVPTLRLTMRTCGRILYRSRESPTHREDPSLNTYELFWDFQLIWIALGLLCCRRNCFTRCNSSRRSLAFGRL